MAEFQAAVSYVLANEGGLEENPHDPGGITNHGISYRFLSAIRPTATEQDIRDLTFNQAIAIYREQFWAHAPYSQIINQNVANYLFDTHVNCGLNIAVKIIQRAIWAIVKQQKPVDDGILGNITLDQINHGGFMLMPPFRAERAGYYRLIVALDESKRQFLEGWLNRTYK